MSKITNLPGFRFVVLAAVALPLSGCSLFRGESKGTTAVTTSHGSMPIRREASNLVDLAQPTVEVSDDNVIVTGNVRLRSNTLNPDARIQISVVDRYGQVTDQIKAKLAETDEDRILTYRVKFGPVPGRGASLLVAYDDYHPFANYSADYIGSGGGGGGAVKGSGGAVSNKKSGTGTTTNKPSSGSRSTKLK